MALLGAVLDPDDSPAVLRCLHLPAFTVAGPAASP